MEKPVRFTSYSKAKFTFLRDHGFSLTEENVRQAVVEPDRVSHSRSNRWIAQRQLSERHVLRVIYEEWPGERVVVTFYPARRSRYESSHEV